ncbi:hypothetical protein J7T55_011750 [Diaporthe amygdali]|uniref:uncharacterized protein n=1 Tax=Phomopsis amygdali TaxID=1214568 RepID=UPI0022FDDBD0|nr:uncharacterized protein J7T55_011750 [Diaporthe amygdali]KAJ0123285.1 hypothetical protein J7T55_011750 [Diaporthe amygdali]
MSSYQEQWSEGARQRAQRKNEIHAELRQMREEAISANVARNFRHAASHVVDPSTEQEVNQRWLEASERKAAAQRERHWDQLQSELREIHKTDRLEAFNLIQRLNGAGRRGEDQADLGRQLQSSRSEAVDSDDEEGPMATASQPNGSLQPITSVSLPGVTVGAMVYPEEVGGSDAGDERDLGEPDESDQLDSLNEHDRLYPSEASDGPLPEIRWVSQKYLHEQGLMGRGIYDRVYRSSVTDALYFLNHMGEKIWLTDAKGDCVLAQGQDL